MTQDVQHDRSAAPLATVSDEIHPCRLQGPEHPGDDASERTPDPLPASTFESDSFEGFGSFS